MKEKLPLHSATRCDLFELTHVRLTIGWSMLCAEVTIVNSLCKLCCRVKEFVSIRIRAIRDLASVTFQRTCEYTGLLMGAIVVSIK